MSVIRKDIEKTSEGRAVRKTCYVCNKWIVWNSLNMCEDHNNEINNENEIIDNIRQDQEESNAISTNNER